MAKGRKEKASTLSEYRAKRAVESTSEPFSETRSDRPGLFVVQKHAARHLHFDLRLEMAGTLKSWAVPKGPSLDPAVKRLAVQVEDHPVEYADFEGLIPEGNYGAGAVIVWDRGRWVALEDPEDGLRKGKLLFELHGYKLRGRWTLFRTKGSKSGPRDWLLVKKPDGFARATGEPPQESILSGLRVEELRDGVDPAAAIRDELRRMKARRGRVEVESIEVMLPVARDAPFSDSGWIYELKYDGFRMLAARDGDRAWLRYRRGQEATASFPEIAAALGRLPFERFAIDGEVVVLDPTGRPSFQALQQRFRLSRARDVRLAALRTPATFVAFDLLDVEGFDVRSLALVDRKRVLRRLLPAAGPLHYSDHVEGRGDEMFAQVHRMGLEGIVAKKADSRYRSGRSSLWLKIRVDRTADLAIVGYTPPKRGRSGFGALDLAYHDGGGWVYAGRVGSGFDDAALTEIRKMLDGERRPDPSCAGAPASGEHAWVEPRRVCEVRYKEWTAGGQLRQPVFVRLRDDKTPRDCPRPDAPGHEAAPPPPAIRPAERVVSFTNPDKVFWPREGYTKSDLIDYYRAVSAWMLPYLADRPLVLTRFPDGIEGKSFFQKDAPGFVPDWVRTETMWSEHAQREIRYFVCDDVETLLYVANMGSIPLHVWSSRVASLQTPDWCILDLDPKDAPFAHVVRVARRIRKLCSEIDLPCFVKSSGSTGLHVLIPLGRQCTYEQSRVLGQLLGRVVAAQLHDIATVSRSLRAREGKVYIDFVQNGHGRLLVAPYSVRPLPGAPVSMPLRWDEVRPKLDFRRFTLETGPGRLRRWKGDPLRPVLELRPDLLAALGRLHDLLETGEG